MGSVQRVNCRQCGGTGSVRYMEGVRPCDLCDEQGIIKDQWIEFDEADEFLADQESILFGEYRHTNAKRLGIDV